MYDMHFHTFHIGEQTERRSISDTYRIVIEQYVARCKGLRILSRHTDDMSTALTDVIYHPVVDRQFLFVGTHSVCDDLIENCFCHIVGFLVLVTES